MKKLTARAIRERDVEKNVVKVIEAAGGIAYKFKSPQRRNVPDRMCLLPGEVLVFIECKAPGKEPTTAQLREHNRIRDLGFRVLVVDNVDWTL
jgi:hypothetical protein